MILFWMLEIDSGTWTQLYPDLHPPESQPEDDWAGDAVDEDLYQAFFWDDIEGYDGQEAFFLLTQPFEDVQAALAEND